MPPPYAHHFYPHLHNPQNAPYDPDMFTLPRRLNIIPSIPRNPFSADHYRAQRLAHEEEDAPYRAYQLACYAAAPLQVPDADHSIAQPQVQWGSGASLLEAIMLLGSVLLRLPGLGWRALGNCAAGLVAGVRTALDVLRLWFGVYVYGAWLSHRPLRMLLLGLATRATCVGVLLLFAHRRVVEPEVGPRYVLVHECRIWSGPFN
ncbi:hypothetical protein ACHAQA_003660 [Verticillium albo-atrum]